MFTDARPSRRSILPRSALGVAIISAVLLIVAVATPAGTAAATTKAATCGVNLRTSPGVSARAATSIATGTQVTVVATVSGGDWRAWCAERGIAGSTWYRITAVNGKSVESLYGVSYVYGASGLFRSVTTTVTRMAACDANVRSRPIGTSTRYATIRRWAKVTVVATVVGGSWRVTCAGAAASGNKWYRIAAIDGRSVRALYGVSYVYSASGRFVAPTPTPTPTATTPAGFVTRSGTKLLLGGQAYRFTGFNIYNANSRNNCWYSLGYNDGALAGSLDAIGTGKEAFRAWFFQRLATTNGARDWSAFDHTLAVAKAKGQRVVVTLSDHWGACQSEGQHNDTWYASGYRSTVYGGDTTTYREFVRQIVTRYRDDPTVLMWQIVNEGEGSHAAFKAFADDMAALIKGIDPNHLVSLGTIGSGQRGAANPTEYRALHASPNIDLLEYHDYAPSPGDYDAIQPQLSARLADAAALGKPLFVGEVGIRLGELGGDRSRRAALMNAKVTEQFAAGVVGFLPWAWANSSGQVYEDYLYTTSDPALTVLAR